MARVLAELEERLAIGLADPRHDARIDAFGQQPRDGERQREPDDGEDVLPHRQLEAVRVEGARHRRHDDVLTVDQRAVAVEDDEVHVGVYRVERAWGLVNQSNWVTHPSTIFPRRDYSERMFLSRPTRFPA